MDPTLLMALSGVPAIAGGLIGRAASQGDRDKAASLRNKALSLYGEITPETLAAVQAQEAGPTEFDRIQEDPRLGDAEFKALRKMQQISDTGFTPEMVAQQRQAEAEAAQQGRAAIGAVKQDAAERGMAGSGSELAASLQAGQGAANRAGMGAYQSAAAAADRSAAATQAAGNFASSMAQRRFQRDSSRAAAQDAINRFNTESNNDFTRWQQGTMLDAQFKKAGAQADLYGQEANAAQKDAADTQAAWTGAGQGASEALGGAAEYAGGGKKKKDD